MIQDIGPLKLDNSYFYSKSPRSGDIIFHFKDGKVLASGNASSPFPAFDEMSCDGEYIHLFSIADKDYYLILDDVSSFPESYSYRTIGEVRHAEGALKENIFAMFTALHLNRWYSENRFCGSCGGSTERYAKERALCCKECGRIIYPRINPAVIVGVVNGDKLLITRYARNRGVGYDALVAGFTEIGETLEQTVEREVFEETGLMVKNIRYYKSQPWGFSGGILVGFYCDLDGDDTVRLDESELCSAVWTKKCDITGQPDSLSLTNEMMIHFRDSDTV